MTETMLPPSDPAKIRLWHIGGGRVSFGPLPLLMGIVNVTPDSFSDGGQLSSAKQAVEHGLRLVGEGAEILDIGGESTRPGSTRVAKEIELSRVLPVVERLAETAGVPISIDTMKADVAEQALAAGAAIVNDVSALTFDARMPSVCAASGCGVIVTHMQGTPETMQQAPCYRDIVTEIVEYLERRVRDMADLGIAPDRVVIDPGIGFGKKAEHNIEILSHISRLHEIGRPVLIGHSRKRFLGRLLGRPIDERTAGTVGVAIALAEQGTEILRVHDVAAVKDALTAWQAIKRGGNSEPAIREEFDRE